MRYLRKRSKEIRRVFDSAFETRLFWKISFFGAGPTARVPTQSLIRQFVLNLPSRSNCQMCSRIVFVVQRCTGVTGEKQCKSSVPLFLTRVGIPLTELRVYENEKPIRKNRRVRNV